VAAVALSLFAFIELRSKSPMLQLGFFRNPTFCGANLVGVIISFGFFGVIFFLSLFMQEVQATRPCAPACCSCRALCRSPSRPSPREVSWDASAHACPWRSGSACWVRVSSF